MSDIHAGVADSLKALDPDGRSEPNIRPNFLKMKALLQLPEPDAGLRLQAAIAKCKAMGRPDPYQERAREMAREAGLDPDGRVDRLGQRSMPIWCTFRDAARKEHLAREAADAANTIAAEKPQAPQFQNRPLKVFGEHGDSEMSLWDWRASRRCRPLPAFLAVEAGARPAHPMGGLVLAFGTNARPEPQKRSRRSRAPTPNWRLSERRSLLSEPNPVLSAICASFNGVVCSKDRASSHRSFWRASAGVGRKVSPATRIVSPSSTSTWPGSMGVAHMALRCKGVRDRIECAHFAEISETFFGSLGAGSFLHNSDS